MKIGCRRLAVSLGLLLAAIAGVIGPMDVARAQQKGPIRPNIIVILADDLGAECLRSYGGSSYQTPNLDALARSGVRFANCYATPLCSPSRVQLMTGRYPFRTGWRNLITRQEVEWLDPKERTFGHVFRAAGYRTALAGKWQLAHFDEHPEHVKQCGFDEYAAWAWVYKGRQTSRYWNPVIWQDGKLREDVADRYGPDVFNQHLTDFITRNQDRPFLAYYPMALVHGPFAPPPGADGARGMRGRNGAHFPAMVAYMDKMVGNLVQTLDRLKLRDRTLILFTGDNGTPRTIISQVGSTPVIGGKGTMTEAGAHVPLIASWPGVIPPGRVSEDLVDLSDILPTIAEVARIHLGREPLVDGRSFAPQLLGKPGAPREWVFSELGRERFVREKRWRLHQDGRLFQVGETPFKETLVSGAASPEAAAAVKRLQPVLDRLK